MVRKGRFDILYDNILGRKHLIRTTSQRLPSVRIPQPSEDNTGLLELASTGSFSGEIDKSYIVQLTQSGTSGEAKFILSNTGGDTFLGYNSITGKWESFTGTNDRLVEFSPIEITEGINIEFSGDGQGEVGDKFFFKGEYGFPIENIHDFRPNKIGQTALDTEPWEAIWDMGSYGFIRADLACFKGFNVPQLTIQANDADTVDGWDSPSVEEIISFVESTGIVNDVKQTRIVYDAANWQQNQLIDKYIKMTSGSANGNVYRITGNYNSEIVVDGAEFIDDGIVSTDTFQIFGSDKYHKFDTEFVNRYVKMTIPTGNTKEGYFQGSMFKIGKSPNFDTDFQQEGQGLNFEANVSITESDSGSEQVNYKGTQSKTFDINFVFETEAIKKAFDAMTGYLKETKTPFVFIPDTNNSGEVFSVRHDPSKSRAIPVNERFSEAWKLKEVR